MKLSKFITLCVLLIIFFDLKSVLGGNPKRILLLNSYHSDFPWTKAIVESVKMNLGSMDSDIEFYTEYMDTKHYFNDWYLRELYSIYKTKYNNVHFDVIISSDDDALNFLRTYHDDLFKGVPVVFCGINNLGIPSLVDRKTFTGVLEEESPLKTIELAMKFHPSRNKIFVLNDFSATGRERARGVKEIENQFQGIEFNYSEDVELDKILTKISALDDKSIILLLGYFNDKNGNFLSYQELMKKLNSVTKVPIYCVSIFHLGLGAIGGVVNSPETQGREAARMVSRILKGEFTENIPILDRVQNPTVVDYKQLKKFGIDSSKIPQSAQIINRPETFYDFFMKNRAYVMGLVSFTMFIILSILIVSLIKILNAKKLIKLSEEQYRSIFENTGSATAIINDEGIIIMSSRKFEELSGYSKKEIEKKISWKLFIQGADQERLENMFKEYGKMDSCEVVFQSRSNKNRSCILSVSGIPGTNNLIASLFDITERKIIETEREILIKQLQEAVSKVNTLSGFLPICTSCKKIRDDKGYWEQIEVYFSNNSMAEFSHSLCPDCVKKLYPDLAISKQ